MSFLRLAELQSLKRMRFSPRNRIRGQYIGLHDSPQQGQNVEFSEYREYNPGDDAGRIDWKVYGRCNRLMVKRFEHQTNLNATLLLDASSSMRYRGLIPAPMSLLTLPPAMRPPPLPNPANDKYAFACRIATAIAYLLIQQKDRVGFAMASRGLIRHVPARGGFPHLIRIQDQMQPLPGQTQASLPEALRDLHLRTPARGTLIVFSDLLEREDEVLDRLRLFRVRGDEILLFHILHRDELELPESGPLLMVDSETGAQIPVRGRDAREAYLSGMRDWLDHLETRCRQEGIDYNLVSTASNHVTALKRYLQERSRVR
jgi:uncharacterized protein (DUF58 family)